MVNQVMDQFASLDHDMSETSQQLQQINKSLGKKIELMTELTNDFQHRSKKIDPIDLDRLLQEEERNLLQKLINYLKFDSRSYSLPAPRLDKFSSFLTRLCAERETVLNELEAETRQLEQQRDARNLSFEADAAKWSQLNKERKLVVQELNDEKKLCNFLSKKFNVQYRKLNEKGELPIVIKKEDNKNIQKIFYIDLERLKSNDSDYIRQVRASFCAQYNPSEEDNPN